MFGFGIGELVIIGAIILAGILLGKNWKKVFLKNYKEAKTLKQEMSKIDKEAKVKTI